MKINIKDNRGFTMVEMLIVIMIMGVLSTLAINGYSQYRRGALLDLSTDDFVSQLSEMRRWAELGQFGGERFVQLSGELEGDREELENEAEGVALCYGLHFQKGVEGFEVNYFNQKFDDRQSWNIEKQAWVYNGCGSFDANAPELFLAPLVLDQNLKVVDLKFGREDALANVANEFVIRFTPPDGKVEVRVDAAEFREPMSPEEVMLVSFLYGVSDDDEYKRNVVYQLLSGNSKVTLFEEL